MEVTSSEESVMTLTLRQGVNLAVKKIQSGTKTQFECGICQELCSSLGYIKVHYSLKHRDPTLKCEFCGLKSFPNEETFNKHLSTFHCGNKEENDINPLQCQVCRKISKDKTALCRHIRESHRDNKFPCSVCSMEYTRPENLKVHMKVAHPSEAEKQLRRTFECKECGKSFKLKTTMRQHIKIAHREGHEKVTSHYCQKEYKGAKVLAVHIAMVHENPRRHECNLCPAKFKTVTHLKRHLNSSIHQNGTKRPRTAEEKQKEDIVNGGDKNRIINQHDGISNDSPSENRPRLGRNCKSFATQIISKYLLKDGNEDDDDDDDDARIKIRHRQKRATKTAVEQPKSSSLKPYSDDSIKKEPYATFQESDGLIVKDIIKIEEPFLYAPDLDAESSYTSWDFNPNYKTIKTENISNHSDDNSEQSDIGNDDDGATTTGENSSKAPQGVVEMMGKKYFCMFCEEGFSSLEAVKIHETPCGQFQKSRKSWDCKECDKVFPSSHTLKRHMARHSDKRPFNCSLCPAKFKGLTSLKNHNSVVHLGQPSAYNKWKTMDHSVTCDKCGKVLSNPKNLRRHEQEVHPDSELDKKPHKCKLCSNRYKRTNELRNHVRFDHEQEKKFECTICSVWFNRQNKLDNHFKRKRHLDKVKKGKKTDKKRHPGSRNILIQNLPETEESGAITKKVMEILLPNAWSNLEVIVAKGRVGPGGRTRTKKIRPLRVILPSVYYRDVALRNAIKLKKEEMLKQLKITKDFWSKDVGIKGGQIMRVKY